MFYAGVVELFKKKKSHVYKVVVFICGRIYYKNCITYYISIVT